ncbi:GNAT family N-acetyltransferase [Yersinia pekkanenii]|uniref:Uncharacterized protein conserved in bacteria n=1 Tax=Yersinia pekkanenii TaxID=1288385 RepID=A0A0T9Q5Q1_9GAMM|nr:GNAT family N-acetyltransferase [Yersinia pekkanenii]CNH97387.1 Uncharacterized protein conserved in bacteria [Yersinia pekkanenii]CRY64361.1 Uncharacterized protein conserved in bacteria [Yersinia pekkanenii]
MFLVSTDKSKLDHLLVYRFLSEQSSWAQGISLDRVKRSIDGSLCFGGYFDDKQVAFARVITDFATFANLVDVFVLPEYRGRGYSKIIIKQILQYPDLQELRRFTLATSDAHGLYAKFGFTALNNPQIFMQRYNPDIYREQD